MLFVQSENSAMWRRQQQFPSAIMNAKRHIDFTKQQCYWWCCPLTLWASDTTCAGDDPISIVCDL